MQNASPWIAAAALAVIALVGVAAWLWRKRRVPDNDPHDAMGFRKEEDSRRLHGEQRRDKSGRWV